MYFNIVVKNTVYTNFLLGLAYSGVNKSYLMTLKSDKPIK